MTDPNRRNPDALVPCSAYAEQIGQAARACGLVDEDGCFPRWVLACSSASWNLHYPAFLQSQIEAVIRAVLSTEGALDALRTLVSSRAGSMVVEDYLTSIVPIEVNSDPDRWVER
jgi:hypothetical protein